MIAAWGSLRTSPGAGNNGEGEGVKGVLTANVSGGGMGVSVSVSEETHLSPTVLAAQIPAVLRPAMTASITTSTATAISHNRSSEGNGSGIVTGTTPVVSTAGNVGSCKSILHNKPSATVVSNVVSAHIAHTTTSSSSAAAVVTAAVLPIEEGSGTYDH